MNTDRSLTTKRALLVGWVITVITVLALIAYPIFMEHASDATAFDSEPLAGPVVGGGGGSGCC